MEKFINRHEAGRILANQLQEYTHNPQVIVLALPRGGVPVGYEIANSLSVPLDIFIVRKLGVPGHEELAMGAIASGDTIIFNEEIIKSLNISPENINAVIAAEKQELKRRELLYRQHTNSPNLHGKIVILVDDGIATGASMRVAIKAIRKQNSQRLIIAVPVSAYSTYKEMDNLVDEIICPFQPLNFHAVGLWYEDFTQTTDEEVAKLLSKSNK